VGVVRREVGSLRALHSPQQVGDPDLGDQAWCSDTLCVSGGRGLGMLDMLERAV
jgi:hypothetical protein